MKAIDWFNKQQIIIQVLIMVIVLYVLYQIYLYADGVAGVIGTQTEIEILQAQGEQPTFTAAQYSQMADDLYEAMDGPGTYYADVVGVMSKLNTTVDFIKLDAAFGLRDSSWYFFDNPVDLKAWIEYELTGDQISQINSLLANKGIKKGF